MMDIDIDLTNKVNLGNTRVDSALSDLRRLQDRNGNFSEKDMEKLRDAADAFEAIFVTQILKNMRRSIPESSLFGEGLAGEFYSGLFDENIAKSISGKGGLKISDTIISSLTNRHSGPVDRTLADYKLRTINRPEAAVSAADWDRSIIDEAAKKYKLDPKLVTAVIKVESAFQHSAVSGKGAVGLMQLMPATAESLGVTNSRDPRQNVFGGAKYLRQLLDRFDGNVELALGAYNAGPSAVEKYSGIPPYKETQRYVEKVLTNYQAM